MAVPVTRADKVDFVVSYTGDCFVIWASDWGPKWLLMLENPGAVV
jgi:hypothetical protein